MAGRKDCVTFARDRINEGALAWQERRDGTLLHAASCIASSRGAAPTGGMTTTVGDGLHAALADALALLRGGDRAAAAARLAPVLGRQAEAFQPDSCLSDAAPLVAVAEELSGISRWKTAQLAYELLVEAGHAGQAWSAGQAAERAALQDAFVARFEATPAIERLAPFLGGATGHPVAALDTTRMRPGLFDMALFRHAIAFADGTAGVEVVEKVMRSDKRDIRRAHAEGLLFGTVDADRLMAPRHFGTLEDGPFVSTFRAYFDGTPLPIDRWMTTHDELLYRYWAKAPPPGLAKGPSLVPVFVDRLKELIARTLPAGVEAQLRACSIDDVALIVARRFDHIVALLDSMPMFVFHDDMHCGNILVGADGGMTIVEWDNWALAPIGTGWRFYATHEVLAEPEVDRIGWARALPPEVTGHNMMLMASLWGWHRALRDQKLELAARWLEKLVRYA